MKPTNHEDQKPGHRFPLELVAKVAAQFLTGKADPELFKVAADSAVKLLDACQNRLDNDLAIEEHRRLSEGLKSDLYIKELKEYLALGKKYPDGMPWTTGLLFITGKKSETQAIVPFKRWRLYRRAKARQGALASAFGMEHSVQPDAMDEADVEDEMKRFRRCGFVPSIAQKDRAEFRDWYKRFGIPAERQKAGRTRREDANGK